MGDNFGKSDYQARMRETMCKALKHVYPEMYSLDIDNDSYMLIQKSRLNPTMENSGSYTELFAFVKPKIHPDDRQHFENVMSLKNIQETFAAGARKVNIECRYLNDNGDWHWFEMIIMRVMDEVDSSDMMALFLGRNVDAQKLAETRLREDLVEYDARLKRQDYYSKLVSENVLVSTIMFSADDRTNILYASGHLLEGFGYTEEECRKFSDNALKGLVYEPDYAWLKKKMTDYVSNRFETFELEYRVYKKDGSVAWISERARLARDDKGRPVYINVLTDVTQLKRIEQELTLRQAETRLALAHSGRQVAYYDIAKDIYTIPAEAALELGCQSVIHNASHRLVESGVVLEDSLEDFRALLESLRSGEPHGNKFLHLRLPTGVMLWYDVKYSVVSLEGVSQDYAVVTYLNVTKERDRELAYERFRQEIENADKESVLYVEANLTGDRVEWVGGRRAEALEDYTGWKVNEMVCHLTDKTLSGEYYSLINDRVRRERMLAAYANNKPWQDLEVKCKVDDREIWAQVVVKTVFDPYSEAVKAYIVINDITEQKDRIQSLLRLAQTDSMTGLYNRGATESLIRHYLEVDTGKRCDLMILDLDDLKHINDQLGHGQGDLALRSIGKVLRSHFRSTDVVGRFGGDEFMIYLRDVTPGAKLNNSIEALLKKLRQITIGENNERKLRCSIGVAVGHEGIDTFETMYKNADIALYFVKRERKDGYAIYSPDMRIHVTHGEDLTD